MRRLLVILSLVAFGLAGCGSSSGDGPTHTVLTDFDYDEFSTSYMAFFPVTVEVHPGDTIDFKQAWTGEPHTVTFGTKLKAFGDGIKPYLTGAKPVPEDEPPELVELDKTVPQFFAEDDIVQTYAQPCYLQTGEPPADGKPCPKVEQPPLNGTETLYNSGFIPYEGNDGNHFKVEIAEGIAPGDYFYTCLIHFGPMSGYVRVKPEGEAIKSQSELSRDTRRYLDKGNKGAINAHKKGPEFKAQGADIQVGSFSAEDGFPFAFINEFYPRKFTTKVGKKVTWSMDYHTVSFNVPKYGPQIIVEKSGKVMFNPKAYEPQGGPGFPEDQAGSDGPPGDTPPPTVDVGNYDGSKFLSSGVPNGAMLYSITFTKPGTYQYACLIHPRMIGTLVVER